MCLRDWLTILQNVFERLIDYITECVWDKLTILQNVFERLIDYITECVWETDRQY